MNIEIILTNLVTIIIDKHVLTTDTEILAISSKLSVMIIMGVVVVMISEHNHMMLGEKITGTIKN